MSRAGEAEHGHASGEFGVRVQDTLWDRVHAVVKEVVPEDIQVRIITENIDIEDGSYDVRLTMKGLLRTYMIESGAGIDHIEKLLTSMVRLLREQGDG